MATSSTSAPANLGILSPLPLELRQKIYSYSIAEGELTVVRVCKSVSNEAASVVSSYGTCRLEFDNNKVPTKYPDASNSDKIQNLYTRLNLTTPNIDRNTFIIPAFNEWMDKFTTWTTASNTGSTPNGPTERLVRPHISCRILIDCNPDYLHHLKDNLYYKDQGFKQIAKLTSFQSLELEIAADSPPSTRGDLRVRMWYQGPDPKRPMPTTNVVTMDTLLAFQVARLALEPTLGEAKWIGRGAGERLALRFCPKEHARRRSGGRA